MNCIILLLLLCCCGGCGNGIAGSNSENCGCESEHCHHHHHHNNCNRERRERAYEANISEDTCGCEEQDRYDAASMTPPSWRDFPGLTRDNDCNNEGGQI